MMGEHVCKNGKNRGRGPLRLPLRAGPRHTRTSWLLVFQQNRLGAHGHGCISDGGSISGEVFVVKILRCGGLRLGAAHAV